MIFGAKIDYSCTYLTYCSILLYHRKGGIFLNIVEPIRDRAKIEAMKQSLLRQSRRNYFLFVLGINIGLRISDIIPLKVRDLQSSHIVIRESKTGKNVRFLINNQLRSEINDYTAGWSPDAYIFPSKKGGYIGRVQAYNILNTAAQEVGLTHIGTHTLRKTFGYFHYKRYKDVALLQTLFGHAAPSITLRYIGITQDEIDDTLADFFL